MCIHIDVNTFSFPTQNAVRNNVSIETKLPNGEIIVKTVIAGHGQLMKPLQMILSLAIYNKILNNLHRVDRGVQLYGISLSLSLHYLINLISSAETFH